MTLDDNANSITASDVENARLFLLGLRDDLGPITSAIPPVRKPRGRVIASVPVHQGIIRVRQRAHVLAH